MGKSLKGKELGKGITQRKDGLYQVSFINRYGKRQTMYAKTASDASKKLSDARYEDAHGVISMSGSKTLNEWFDTWESLYKSECRNTTLRIHRYYYSKVRDSLGSMKLSSIKTIDIQSALGAIESASTRLKVKGILIDIFDRAIESEYLTKNPARAVVVKKGAQSEKRVLSKEEEEKLLSVLPDTDYMKELVGLALCTGMRIGEILGLKFSDVDEEAGFIFVRRNLVTVSVGGHLVTEFHDCKTRNSVRAVPLTKKAIQILKNSRRKKSAKVLKFQEVPGFEDLIFTSRTNRPIFQSNVLRSVKEYGRLAGIDGVIGMHTMRHTFATRCIERGMKPKVLQKILGHSSITITMDLYCHVEEESLKSELKNVVDLL